MPAPRVLLVLKDDQVVRTASVISSTGGSHSVRWDDDGTAETVKAGRHDGQMYMTAVEGGLQHLRHTEVTRLTSLLNSSPADVFVMALRELTKPVQSRDLIKNVNTALNSEAANDAWRIARKPFEADPNVFVHPGTPPRYSLATDAAPAPRREPVRASDAEAEEVVEEPSIIAAPVPEPAGETEPTPISEVEIPAGVAEDLGERRRTKKVTPPDPKHADPEEIVARHESPLVAGDTVTPAASPKAAPQSRLARSLVDDLNKLAAGKADDELVKTMRDSNGYSDDALRLVHDILTVGASKASLSAAKRSPLATAAAVGKLSEGVVNALLQNLDAHDLGLLLGLPRASRALDKANALALLEPDEVQGVLELARRELASAPKDTRTQLQLGFAFLIDRVLASPGTSALPLERLLSSALALSRADRTAERGDVIAATAAASLRTSGPGSWSELGASNHAALADLVHELPLGAKTGRALLLTAIAKADPDEIQAQRWWVGATFDTLADAAEGPLASVLELPEVVKTIVAPLAVDALTAASTRRRLTTLLGCPLVIARSMPAELVARAWQSVAENDSALESWTAALRDDVGRARVESQLASHVAELARVRADAEAARDEARVAAERCERLEAQLASTSASTTQLRASQERQLQIDVKRELAQIAAFVEDSVTRLSPERLVERVSAMAKRSGLERVGEIGATEPYDPVMHDIVGPHVEDGEPVLVRRVGYIWAGTNGGTVLTRALVARTT